jgi:hypothetical protein
MVLVQHVYAQQVTLHGHVIDAGTGEALIGANVFVSGTATGTITNAYGFYSLTLPTGTYNITYSYIGYSPLEQQVELTGNVSQTAELTEITELIEEVVITAEGPNENIVSTRMGSEKLTGKIIERVPVLFGEADVIKTLRLMPGVKSTGEMSSNLSVRGGTLDQNLILLDEAVVYNASHLGGMFSVFNNDAIKDVELYKGIMPAKYGGRLSSMIDIRMKEGNTKEFTGMGGVGLISSRLTLETPIVKNNGSIMISGRRTYLDLITKAVSAANPNAEELPYFFYDLNAKANYTINSKHRIYLSGYFGRDLLKLSIDNDAGFRFDWGNYTGSLRWNYVISNKLFSNVTFLASNYNYIIDQSFRLGRERKTYSFNWDAFLKDYTIKVDMGYFINPRNTMNFGVQTMYHDFNVAEIDGRYDTINYDYRIPKIYALEHAMYAGNEYNLSTRWIVEYGLRFSMLQNIGPATVYELENYNVVDTTKYDRGNIYENQYGLEPRLGITYIVSDNQSIKFGYSRTRQYLQVASNSVSGTPLDVWVPSGPNIKPQIADQVSVGYFRNVFDNKIKTSAEVYYKYMQNQIDFKEFSQPYLNPTIEEDFRFGVGRAYGLEIMLKKPRGRITGWISYTLSVSERRIKGILEKDWYLSPYDSPHDISVVGSYQLSKRITVSANWVYQTGRPLNAPVARYDYGNLVVPVYPGRNKDRLPDYHRLDVALELKNKPRKNWQGSWTFSVYNAYNRRNANIVYFEQDNGDSEVTTTNQVSLLPMIPTVSYNFTF